MKKSLKERFCLWYAKIIKFMGFAKARPLFFRNIITDYYRGKGDYGIGILKKETEEDSALDERACEFNYEG